jgi:hypothetical protein
MTKVIDGLKQWRVERNMDNKEFVMDVEISNLLEECAEYLRAKDDYEKIDALCDIVVFSINSYKYLDGDFNQLLELDFNIVDNNASIYDVLFLISSFYLNERPHKDNLAYIIQTTSVVCNSLGFDFDKCMLETIKEISSRNQDPIQKEEWAKNGINGKWQKDKNQDKSTLYKANYESCKK